MFQLSRISVGLNVSSSCRIRGRGGRQLPLMHTTTSRARSVAGSPRNTASQGSTSPTDASVGITSCFGREGTVRRRRRPNLHGQVSKVFRAVPDLCLAPLRLFSDVLIHPKQSIDQSWFLSLEA
jgi:hypothetical protein